MVRLLLLLCLSLPCWVVSQCPFSGASRQVESSSTPSLAAAKEFAAAASTLDFDAIKKDLKALFTQSQAFWPADFGNYGPFFVRQAWHCAGSYRTSDGHGGCDGGRQRFDPERSWDDNTNLDKAKRLLWPIKQKYGAALSWGDLIILTGTTAIESMGGPVLGFCAGRIDDMDGSASVDLGPTAEQQAKIPCPVNGQCKWPLGTTTVGLIYVNPEGPMGNPIPSQSAMEIRDTFGRMAMDDYETVALIGGGHTFGKAHGACPLGPGPSPQEDPANPWPGKCGSGKGADTFTSGFEGAWTFTPTKWSNSYFQELLGNTWEVHIGPGGKHQWRVANATKPIMMLTSDIALLNDPLNKYQDIVKLFASNLTAFGDAFSRAWYKLTTRDMGPISRCVGKLTPPPQPFQYPLPAPSSAVASLDWSAVRAAVKTAMTTSKPDILVPDMVDGKANYGAVFVYLAWQCATTFRATDYLGGCNGARIRFAPQSQWSVNAGMTQALKLLQPVKDQFGDALSWADLIVFSAQVALEEAGSPAMTFCPGRTDATDGTGSQYLAPNLNMSASADELRDRVKLMGLSLRDMVVLSGRLRSNGQQVRLGFNGTWATNTVGQLSNAYFTTLLGQDWQAVTVASSGKQQYQATGKDLFMVPTDLHLKYQADLLALAQEYAQDNSLFLADFAAAWTRLMNIDRFDGPAGTVCPASAPASSDSSSGLGKPALIVISAAVTALVCGVAFWFYLQKKESSGNLKEPLINSQH